MNQIDKSALFVKNMKDRNHFMGYHLAPSSSYQHNAVTNITVIQDVTLPLVVLKN